MCFLMSHLMEFKSYGWSRSGEMLIFLFRPLKTILSVMADSLRCAFCCLLSPACPLSAPAFVLFSSYSISKQIGFYSLSLSISHLSLSISTTVQKQFYYVRLYFYSQLKRLLKYNIACRAQSNSALASCTVLKERPSGESGIVP